MTGPLQFLRPAKTTVHEVDRVGDDSLPWVDKGPNHDREAGSEVGHQGHQMDFDVLSPRDSESQSTEGGPGSVRDLQTRPYD